MHIIDNRRVPLEHAHLALFAVTTCVWHEAPPSLVHIPPQGWAPSWVCQLGFALGQGADRGFIPRRQLVKEAHGFQGELTLDRQADINWQYHGLAIGLLRRR